MNNEQHHNFPAQKWDASGSVGFPIQKVQYKTNEDTQRSQESTHINKPKVQRRGVFSTKRTLPTLRRMVRITFTMKVYSIWYIMDSCSLPQILRIPVESQVQGHPFGLKVGIWFWFFLFFLYMMENILEAQWK